MNEDTFEGLWKQIKGEIRVWWGKLSDNEVEEIAGNKDKLLGALQERYGYTRQRAEDEINTRLREYRTKHPRKMDRM
jgi:uncharacterized protein YjbJ (UPF0337 family)